jgi:hypothetical protein
MSIYEDINSLLDDCGSSKVPTGQENREHFKRILVSEGNTEFDNFIRANLRLIADVLKKFLKRHSATYLVDDLFSTGLYTMVLVLKLVVEQAREDPKKFWSGIGREDASGHFHVMMYLYISVYKKIQECYEHESVRAISSRTAERFTPDGGNKPVQKVNIPEHVFEQIESDSFEMVFLQEDILDHCHTDIEREIITMRLTMADREIAEILGFRREKVFFIRKEIYNRYQKGLNHD